MNPALARNTAVEKDRSATLSFEQDDLKTGENRTADGSFANLAFRLARTALHRTQES